MIILKEQNEGGRLDESPLHRRLDGDDALWHIAIVAFNGIVPKLALLVPWRCRLMRRHWSTLTLRPDLPRRSLKTWILDEVKLMTNVVLECP